jgi:hypothetical protein
LAGTFAVRCALGVAEKGQMMAGDWIKMRGNLWDDPRVTNLCDITESMEASVIGGLYWLWATADQHSEDGVMPGLTLRSIERKTGINGFGSALVSIGWLADHPEGVRLVRFDEHNGESAKKRCVDAKRKANVRCLSEKLRTDEGHIAEEKSRFSELEKEKRREEKELNTLVSGCAADLIQIASTSKLTCPHQSIIDLYHAELPVCPRIKDWTPARQAHMRARWNEDTERQDLDYWQRLFGYIATCDFLVGKGGGTRPFFAGLEWIVKSENFAKIREGKYQNNESRS